MIAVIFEVHPADGQKRQEYLDIAASLKPHLEKVDGFVSVERFQSLTDPSKILSLSFFENEEAVASWRTLEVHRNGQKSGRQTVFENYRLRIAGVIRDYGMFERDQAPDDSRQCHDQASNKGVAP